MKKWLTNQSPEEHYILLNRDDCAPDIIHELAHSTNLKTVEATALHYRIPHKTQILLATHPEPQIRVLLTKNPALHSTVFETLCEETQPPSVLLNAAVSTHLTTTTSQLLFNSGEEKVHIELAWNPKTSLTVLTQIYNQHKTETVFIALASNPSTPEPVLQELSEIPNLAIKTVLAKSCPLVYVSIINKIADINHEKIWEGFSQRDDFPLDHPLLVAIWDKGNLTSRMHMLSKGTIPNSKIVEAYYYFKRADKTNMVFSRLPANPAPYMIKEILVKQRGLNWDDELRKYAQPFYPETDMTTIPNSWVKQLAETV